MKKTLFILSLAFYFNTNAQIITTVAGNGTGGATGTGGQATAAELYYPEGVIVDAAGNMYIADTDNSLVRKVSTSGIITTILGTGTAGFSGDGGQATAAKTNYPRGLVFDAIGNLYISESFNHRIRKINTAGIITTIAGNGTAGFSGDGGLATAAEFHNPYQIAFDAAGNLYIADFNNNRVRKVNTAGIISTIAGSGATGTGTGSFGGDGGQATAANLNSPSGVSFDAMGNLYIADLYNNRIRMVNTTGIINTYGGNGTGAYSGDGGQATAAEIYQPWGVTHDAAGNLYIGDTGNNRVRKISTLGIISTVAGDGFGTLGAGGYSGDVGQATAAEINYPAGVSFDAAGNMYFADGDNHRIRKVTNSTTMACHVTQTGYTSPTCAGVCNATVTFNIPASCSGSSNPVYAVWTNGGVGCTSIPTATLTPGSTYTVGGICGCGISYQVLFTNNPITQDSSYVLTGSNIIAGNSISITDPTPPQIQNITQTSHTLCLGSQDDIILSVVVGTGISPISSSWTSSLGPIINHTNISNTLGHNKDTLKATPTTTTHYTVFITDANGCVSASDTLSVIVESCGAGINQVTGIHNQVIIYPNPNNGSFVIEPQNTLYNVHCTVYDVNGREVLTKSINGKTTIDASSLNEGVYNISLQSNEGMVNKRLVIVR